jgi:hypothetical protein
MKKTILTLGLIAAAAVPAAAMQQQANSQTAVPRPPTTVRGELTLYEMVNYNGDTKVIDNSSAAVRTDWNIRSVSIHPGDRWQICARARFRDPCIILDRSVHDASLIGIEGQIGSARPAPAEQPQGN